MKKYFLSTIIFLILLFLTYYFIFKECDFPLLISSLQNTKPIFLIGAFLCMVIYVLLGSFFIKRILYYFKIKVSFFKTLGYYFTEIYFSAITPSYIGGQPIQMLEMKKDKIPYQTSSIVVLFSSMLNRIALIIIATILLLFYFKEVFALNHIYNWLVILGYLTTIMVIIGFAALIYSPKVGEFLKKVVKFLIKHFKFLQKKPNLEENFNKALNEYQACAEITKKNKRLVWECLGIMIFQRLVLLLTSYMVYLAFGFSKYSLFLVMAFQVCVTLGSDLTPTPGGVMVNESLLLVVNKLLYGEALALSGMLLLRSFNFYLLTLISAIGYVIFHFQKRKACELLD